MDNNATGVLFLNKPLFPEAHELRDLNIAQSKVNAHYEMVHVTVPNYVEFPLQQQEGVVLLRLEVGKE